MFFILGNPRSGTTMLRLMLTAHPAICVPPECGFALWLWNKYRTADPTDPDVVSRFSDDVFEARKFETWGIPRKDLRKSLLSGRYRNYAEMAQAVYAAYATLHNRTVTHYGDKNNFYVTISGSIRDAFPDAQIIHLVRDVRDVVCSYLDVNSGDIRSDYRPRLPRTPANIAREWRQNVERVMVMPEVLLVRYEDILGAPEESLRSVVQHLGLEFTPQMLDFYKVNDEPKEFLAWKSKTRQALRPEQAGRFRRTLTQAQIDEILPVAQATLEKLGYDTAP